MSTFLLYIQIGSVTNFSSRNAKNDVIKYASGEGNDTIYGFDSNDTLHITAGSYSTTKSGNDFVVKVGEEKITFKDALYNKYNKIAIKNAEGKVSVYNDWKVMQGTSDKDTLLHNNVDNVTILGGTGNDVINNIGYEVVVKGKAGNDIIHSYGSNNTLDGGAGDDTIEGGGPPPAPGAFVTYENASISGGAGNDVIIAAYSNNYTINGGLGNDSIYSGGSSNTINGGIGNDSIYSDGSNNTISGGAGSDSIYSYGENVTINGGAGNDSIYNRGKNVSINGGSGNDTLYLRYSSNSTINGGAGNDSIYSYTDSKNNTIDGGAGSDLIYSYKSNNTISGGTGDDSIYSGGLNTISGGTGNDKISLSSSYERILRYASGDGNDTIYGFNDDDTLHITKGSFSTQKSGNDFVVKVGKNSILIKDAVFNSNRVTIKNSKGKVAVYNNWSNIKSGTSGDNILYNSDFNVTISGGAGNDSIYNRGEDVTINGGAGADSISNSGENVTINGGAGDDYISNSGENNLIQYASGDGNDTIYGFNSDDTLHITKGSYSAKASSNDVIVTVGKGKIILKNAAGQKISIKNSKGKVKTKTYGSSSSALLEENNFVTADNFSELVKNDLTATDYEIKPKNFENLAQENNFLTFADK